MVHRLTQDPKGGMCPDPAPGRLVLWMEEGCVMAGHVAGPVIYVDQSVQEAHQLLVWDLPLGSIQKKNKIK